MSIKILLHQRYTAALISIGVVLGLSFSVAATNHVFAQTNGPVAASDDHIVTIYDRDTEKNIVTKARTVKEALQAADIQFDEQKDLVEPALGSELVAAKYSVNIYRAKPVTIVDGAMRRRVTTAYQTSAQIAEAANITLHQEDEVTLGGPQALLVDGADLVMTIKRATAVKLTLYGKVLDVRTQVKTVDELLKEKKVTLGPDDTLSISRDTLIQPGLHVEVWRNGSQTITSEEEIDFPVEKINDANRPVGFREVKQPGVKGRRSVTYDIEMRNGLELSRKEIASVIVVEPKKQIEIAGAKPSFDGDFAAALAKLRSCEGGYNSWNPAGPYYGAYQFDERTWRGVSSAPYGNASPAEQDAAARQLYLQRGWQPWPVCGAARLPDIYR